jgi:SAM-dependent methyltransferase
MLCLFCENLTEMLFSARDYERPEDKTAYSVFWCNKCKFGSLAGDYTPAEIAAFYPATYYTHGASSGGEVLETFRQRLLFHLAWRLDSSRPVTADLFRFRSSVCDIGCGNGDQLRLFPDARTVGVDPDPAARMAAADAGTIFAGTAEELPADVSDDSFDVVILSHVLEHCRDPRNAIRSAKSILASGGTLMIEVPNSDCAGFVELREIWPWSDIPRHLSFFTQRSIQSLVESEGLKVRSTEHCGFTRQFSVPWREKQSLIWDRIGAGRKPSFELAAWRTLARSIMMPASRIHDSLRVFVSN